MIGSISMYLKVCYLLSRLLPGEKGVIVGGCAANCVSLALELKRQGREFVTQNYSWDTIACELIDAYQEGIARYSHAN